MTPEIERRHFGPNWQRKCDNCGQSPVVGQRGDLCGPCYFGTADALNGGWWDDKANAISEAFAEEHLPEAK
jgi:hypothetical protein